MSPLFDVKSVFSADASQTIQDVGTAAKNPTSLVDKAMGAGSTSKSGGKSKKSPQAGSSKPDPNTGKPDVYFKFPASYKGMVGSKGGKMDYESETAIQLKAEDFQALGLTELVKFAQLVLGLQSGSFWLGLVGHAKYADFISGIKGKEYKTDNGYTLPMNIKTAWFDFWVQDEAGTSHYSLLDDQPSKTLGAGEFDVGGLLAKCGIPLEVLSVPDESDGGEVDAETDQGSAEGHGMSVEDAEFEVVQSWLRSAEVLVEDDGFVVTDVTDDEDVTQPDQTSSEQSDGSSWISPFTGVEFAEPSGETLATLVKSKSPALLLISFERAVAQMRTKFKVTR